MGVCVCEGKPLCNFCVKGGLVQSQEEKDRGGYKNESRSLILIWDFRRLELVCGCVQGGKTKADSPIRHEPGSSIVLQINARIMLQIHLKYIDGLASKRLMAREGRLKAVALFRVETQSPTR